MRRAVRVRGIVQGVGFRPFVRRLATELALTGWVRNDSEGVLAEVQGTGTAIEEFCRRVRADAPPLASVTSVEGWDLTPLPGARGFRIDLSEAGSGRTLAPPDVATCDDCLREFSDPGDRRYRHPFITCTNCGPRFTIIRSLPYDRPSTTMDRFPMCDGCRAEYEDPDDRRYHAQPISCHDCGPVLELVRPGHAHLHREEALAAARALLAGGRIVAVKGIGGYHLACDATDEGAVRRLRERKRRPDRPFALLAADVDTVRGFADLWDPAVAAVLQGPRRPIVLVPRRPDRRARVEIADAVSPGLSTVGVMLPPSAMHALLVAAPGPAALVLTSANTSGEPLVTDDDEALARLDGIADAWLRHDRPIHVPCDDSVVEVRARHMPVTWQSGTAVPVEAPVRRSRGWAPVPVRLPLDTVPMLATGGDLKNTVALADGTSAWLSAHVGDMDDVATLATARHATGHLEALVGVTPQHIAVDAHPGYRSSAWGRRLAAERGLEVTAVQHHHAHIAATMADHGMPPDARVVGLALDGTGYGSDGAVWGGEMLLAGYASFQRLAHLSNVPLPGGDAAVKRPYRMALAHLWAAGVAWTADLPPVAACPPGELAVLRQQLEKGVATVATSSAGRLFDAVASILGIRHEVTYEAQAAMELESCATAGRFGPPAEGRTPRLPLPLVAGDDGVDTWDCGALVRSVVDYAADRSYRPADLAAMVLQGLAESFAEAAAAAARRHRVDCVALGGGVWANGVLSSEVARLLAETGLQVLEPYQVPCNDGGLALGQIAVAAARL